MQRFTKLNEKVLRLQKNLTHARLAVTSEKQRRKQKRDLRRQYEDFKEKDDNILQVQKL